MYNNRKIIGIAISSIFEKPNYDLVSTINKNLVANGYRLMVFHCNSHFYGYLPEEIGETRIYEMMPFEILDGLIVYEETFSVRKIAGWIIELAQNHNIPTYVIGGTNKGTINFEFNYRPGFEAIVRHIIEDHKISHPIFMGGIPGNDYSDSRQEIFKTVCIENNLPYDEEKMVIYGRFFDGPAKEAIRKYLQANPLPDAIVCANDDMAIAVCAVLSENNYRVPEEVIVSGFDGNENVYYSNPQISTVFCSPFDLADAITDEIFDRKSTGLVRIKPKLTILESCGCNKKVLVNGAEMQSRLHNRLNQYMDKENRLINMGYRMQNCSSIDELGNCLNYPWMDDVTFMCSPDAIDETVESLGSMPNEIPDWFVCIFDKICRKNNSNAFLVEKEELIPNFDTYIEREVPLIFNAVFINDTLLGFYCLHSEQMSVETGFILPQLSISLRLGMIGYQRNKHQELLNDRMIELYKTDDLTGLYLRRAISVEFGRLSKTISSGTKKLAVLLADLDGLKFINDKYGHEEGDKAIIAVAKALRDAVPADSAVFRYGGDEMLALFSTEGDTNIVRESIKKSLEQYNEEFMPPYTVSASIGIVIENDPVGKRLKDMIDMADKHMYSEKNAKKQSLT